MLLLSPMTEPYRGVAMSEKGRGRRYIPGACFSEAQKRRRSAPHRIRRRVRRSEPCRGARPVAAYEVAISWADRLKPTAEFVKPSLL